MDGGIAHIPCTSFVQPSRLQLYEDVPNHLLNAAFKSHLHTLAAILQRSKKIGKLNWEGEVSKRAFREGDSPEGGLRISNLTFRFEAARFENLRSKGGKGGIPEGWRGGSLERGRESPQRMGERAPG